MNLESKFSSGTHWFLLTIIVLVWLSLFLMRWSAPPDLLDKDQERPASYMADAALNGNWIVQVDDHGKVTSKPPLYTWIGACIILVVGRTHDIALYLPTGLSVLGCCFLIWNFGRRYFSPHAALIGALALLLSSMGLRILYLARTDALFSCLTFLTACAGFVSWKRGGGWLWFWGMATLTALTKGPLGLVLALGGFIGLFIKDRFSFKLSRTWSQHAIGVIAYMAVISGWLFLAYLQLGDAVIAKIVGREHIGHMNWAADRFSLDFFFFTKPTLYFIGRFFPWSIPAIWGLWRVLKMPAENARERDFEIFLSSYLIFGVAFFSIFPHQRPDHLFPLLPAASLLAGRQLLDWFNNRKRIKYSLRNVMAFWLIVLAGYAVYYHKIDPATNHWFEKTAGVKQVAQTVEETYRPEGDIHFVDVPYGLQFYLNTMKVRISPSEAAQELTRKDKVFVAVRNIEALVRQLPHDFKLYTLIRWPLEGEAFVYIVSNTAPVSKRM